MECQNQNDPEQINSTKGTQFNVPTVNKPEDVKVFSVTIGREPEEVFAFWRHFENLSHFMKELESVRVVSPTLSHWVVSPKVGPKLEWDAVVIDEEYGRMIAWRSLDGQLVETTGRIWFDDAPQGLGTVVRLALDYSLPGGKLAELAAFVTGDKSETLAEVNLRRLKALLETGEIPTTEGQSSGRDEDNETSSTLN